MSEETLEHIESYLRQIAEDLHVMREAQAAELKLIMTMLPSQPQAQPQPQPQLQFWPSSTCSVYRK